jgi:hypothetical protein
MASVVRGKLAGGPTPGAGGTAQLNLPCPSNFPMIKEYNPIRIRVGFSFIY